MHLALRPMGDRCADAAVLGPQPAAARLHGRIRLPLTLGRLGPDAAVGEWPLTAGRVSRPAEPPVTHVHHRVDRLRSGLSQLANASARWVTTGQYLGRRRVDHLAVPVGSEAAPSARAGADPDLISSAAAGRRARNLAGRP